MSQFAIGDVVQLKSGGPKMTVTRVLDDSTDLAALIEKKGFIQTTWFAGSKKESGTFPPETIIKMGD